jgi:hypothetical protein
VASDCCPYLYHLQEKFADLLLPLGIGSRIWWRSIHAQPVQARESMSEHAPTHEYLCHTCYIGQRTWSAAMPKGYEDVESLKSLEARHRQLNDPTAIHYITKDSWALRKHKLWNWCSHHDWVRKLPWPTHQPLSFEQKQQLACTDCLFAKRRPLYV